MIYLNLISPKQKKEIKLQQAYLRVKNLLFFTTLLTLIIATCLLAGRYLLQNNFTQVVEQTSLVLKRQESYKEKINQVNQLIEHTNNIQSLHIRWSDLLLETGKLAPDNISIYSIQIQDKEDPAKEKKESSIFIDKPKEKIIKINGFIDTRDEYLNFVSGLKKSSYFLSVESPFSNILKEKNIEFEITAEINQELLQ